MKATIQVKKDGMKVTVSLINETGEAIATRTGKMKMRRGNSLDMKEICRVRNQIKSIAKQRNLELI